MGPLRRPVSHPELGTGAIRGRKQDASVADVRKASHAREAAVRTWIDVCHQVGPFSGSIADPRLKAIRAIVDGKQRSSITSSKNVEHAYTDWAWPDVFDQMRAFRGAVGHPGFKAVDAIVRGKKHLPIAEGYKAKL